jgi:hypothetical protein
MRKRRDNGEQRKRGSEQRAPLRRFGMIAQDQETPLQ